MGCGSSFKISNQITPASKIDMSPRKILNLEPLSTFFYDPSYKKLAYVGSPITTLNSKHHHGQDVINNLPHMDIVVGKNSVDSDSLPQSESPQYQPKKDTKKVLTGQKLGFQDFCQIAINTFESEIKGRTDIIEKMSSMKCKPSKYQKHCCL